MSPARIAEVDRTLHTMVEFATAHDVIRGVVLVGSWARDTARTDSDIDVVVLSPDPTRLSPETWLQLLGGDLVRRQWWGPLDEIRIRLASDLDVEIGVVPLSWAAHNPVDAGTHRVMADGNRILYDPDGLLAQLADACRQSRPTVTRRWTAPRD